MGTYIPFTEEQKLRASSVDLEEFLRRRGERLVRAGREKRLSSDHSVTVRGKEWYDHAAQRGGGPISFVQQFYRMTYPEAVSLLLEGEGYPLAREEQPQVRKPFVLPPRNQDMRRVYAYLLKQRHLDRDVVAYFARAGTLYEDAQYHNCVFVGTDAEGTPRHAHKRSATTYGKPFRANVEGSDPRYSFHHLGTDGTLFVFEAPIDLLSYITLYPEHWQSHSYVACCGTSFLPVEQMKTMLSKPLEQLCLCLDNDEAGHSACERMVELSREWGAEVLRLCPERKDWNEDLTAQEQKEEHQWNMCQTFGA